MAEHESSHADAALHEDAHTPRPEILYISPEPGRSERLALRTMQAGAIAVVLVAATWKEFELDRFFVPKELVLHVTAFTAGLFALRAITRMRFSRVDLLLIGFILISALSAFMAENGWVAARALAVSASGILVFWTARALRSAGLHRPLLAAIAMAVVIGTATSLMQTYGISTDFFSLNRAPGGTLGNRNFIAHLAAFGLPVVLFVAVSASHWSRYLLAGAGAMLVAGTLVLTRSRAGFVALAAVLSVLLAALLLSPRLRTHGRIWARVAGIALLAGVGIAAAVFVPNSLNWRSDNPYLESITGVANYQEGSGRGRLVQYRQSMVMAARNPVLGVGPGNWAVEYADYAAPRDPSLDSSAPGTTSNPWPSSDWVAVISERGFAAALLLGLALAGIALTALRRLLRAAAPGEALAGATLLATIAAAAVAGMFDAVM
ncbi:MAG: O-antigen ligase family protein, partial [Longimicrobiales bacterium]